MEILEILDDAALNLFDFWYHEEGHAVLPRTDSRSIGQWGSKPLPQSAPAARRVGAIEDCKHAEALLRPPLALDLARMKVFNKDTQRSKRNGINHALPLDKGLHGSQVSNMHVAMLLHGEDVLLEVRHDSTQGTDSCSVGKVKLTREELIVVADDPLNRDVALAILQQVSDVEMLDNSQLGRLVVPVRRASHGMRNLALVGQQRHEAFIVGRRVRGNYEARMNSRVDFL